MRLFKVYTSDQNTLSIYNYRHEGFMRKFTPIYEVNKMAFTKIPICFYVRSVNIGDISVNKELSLI